jgi:hypothetical protein
MAVWYSLWSFVIFSQFGTFDPEKSGNPDLDVRSLLGQTVLNVFLLKEIEKH